MHKSQDTGCASRTHSQSSSQLTGIASWLAAALSAIRCCQANTPSKMAALRTSCLVKNADVPVYALCRRVDHTDAKLHTPKKCSAGPQRKVVSDCVSYCFLCTPVGSKEVLVVVDCLNKANLDHASTKKQNTSDCSWTRKHCP